MPSRPLSLLSSSKVDMDIFKSDKTDLKEDETEQQPPEENLSTLQETKTSTVKNFMSNVFKSTHDEVIHEDNQRQQSQANVTESHKSCGSKGYMPTWLRPLSQLPSGKVDLGIFKSEKKDLKEEEQKLQPLEDNSSNLQKTKTSTVKNFIPNVLKSTHEEEITPGSDHRPQSQASMTESFKSSGSKCYVPNTHTQNEDIEHVEELPSDNDTPQINNALHQEKLQAGHAESLKKKCSDGKVYISNKIRAKTEEWPQSIKEKMTAVETRCAGIINTNTTDEHVEVSSNSKTSKMSAANAHVKSFVSNLMKSKSDHTIDNKSRESEDKSSKSVTNKIFKSFKIKSITNITKRKKKGNNQETIDVVTPPQANTFSNFKTKSATTKEFMSNAFKNVAKQGDGKKEVKGGLKKSETSKMKGYIDGIVKHKNKDNKNSQLQNKKEVKGMKGFSNSPFSKVKWIKGNDIDEHNAEHEAFVGRSVKDYVKMFEDKNTSASNTNNITQRSARPFKEFTDNRPSLRFENRDSAIQRDLTEDMNEVRPIKDCANTILGPKVGEGGKKLSETGKFNFQGDFKALGGKIDLKKKDSIKAATRTLDRLRHRAKRLKLLRAMQREKVEAEEINGKVNFDNRDSAIERDLTEDRNEDKTDFVTNTSDKKLGPGVEENEQEQSEKRKWNFQKDFKALSGQIDLKKKDSMEMASRSLSRLRRRAKRMKLYRTLQRRKAEEEKDDDGKVYLKSTNGRPMRFYTFRKAPIS
jgi:hypothetical protein